MPLRNLVGSNAFSWIGFIPCTSKCGSALMSPAGFWEGAFSLAPGQADLVSEFESELHHAGTSGTDHRVAGSHVGSSASAAEGAGVARVIAQEAQIR